VTACHAENNISTVGAEQAARGRAKHWIPWSATGKEIFQTRGSSSGRSCASSATTRPASPVCPTYASHHTADGLNAQVYNRCIGTRYCANACPYNVRFFDFFNPSWDKPLHLQLNPDVSLREVGVKEKCTFCVQRIKAVTIQAKGRRPSDRRRRNPARPARRRARPGRWSSATSISRERGVAAVQVVARQQAARGSRHPSERDVPDRQS
jgi:molybdopterin-containing oxidoreductase family iron-sulfur binding subunit